ncbi:DPP IV N-terminal domain-containing protein [Mucilaginibacter sabulilitoris]|uniref:DPP IV N-terminal domain-containing protein n=1 Tax=Mucilaginibacter sabulilitoris TaxID=1173583 RepID=A0ABZ0TMV4_9SPHI|nr:DPP IV N-terminal domain-containing protein [Mucilaginibacter sabulilitoris]WPU94496.1 DPP IV N-terminal domain-containing protein [Mucilaginibacter sabulilitoris]
MNKYLLSITAAAFALTANAQQGHTLTENDYAHAESFMSYITRQLVDHDEVTPNWMAGDKFWYRVLTAQGSEFILVDPAKKSRTAAFDQQKLAAALSAAAGKTYSGNQLPFTSIGFSADGKSVSFIADGKSWKCDLKTYQCTPDNAVADASGHEESGNNDNEVFSPDGKLAAYIKDDNLWVRNVATGQQTQLTTDGEKDFGYATDNAGWKSSDTPILRWSPDSKKIATFKQDQRKVGDMYLVTTNVGHPTLKAWKYPLPGDKEIAMIQRVIINVDNPKVINIQIAPDPHRATLSDDIASSGTFDDVDWNADASKLAFVSTSRDHKQEKFRIADVATGAVREVFEETVPTQYESGQGTINWKYLAKTNEIIWFSERDNWGHLYLYDVLTGKVKNQITKGSWAVTQLLKVDEKNRQIYFLADGREPGNPYFTHFYRVGFDGKNLTLLTPEAGTHEITLSPTNNYFIDTYSSPDVAPVRVLRSINGKLISTLEKTDISRLVATGWKPPVPVAMKAHDGKTDIYGLMFVPTKLDPSKKYPIINNIYPGPQGGSVGDWGFEAAHGDCQALAELGFVVVQIEGTSNPLRSKSYHDMNYGHMSENTLPDQITAMQQLAQKYPYIDISRAGIWGHSGGGFATAAAMFRFPDFFKVGISESGNHDNRNYEDDWGERYIGLLTQQPDGTSNYEAQANQNYAKNLKGKLMLAHGLFDDNVPPYNTMLVVEALEKANKNYDLVVFPNSAHGYGKYSLYMTRRRWDYFVKNLAGNEPPKEYQLTRKADPRDSIE